jgi:hypothetical protein
VLFENLKIKIYESVSLFFVLYEREACSFMLREEYRVGMFEN